MEMDCKTFWPFKVLISGVWTVDKLALECGKSLHAHSRSISKAVFRLTKSGKDGHGLIWISWCKWQLKVCNFLFSRVHFHVKHTWAHCQASRLQSSVWAQFLAWRIRLDNFLLLSCRPWHFLYSNRTPAHLHHNKSWYDMKSMLTNKL